MVFFPLDVVLRGFPAAAYIKYASLQTLVRLYPAKKIRIYELDTQQCLKKITDGHEPAYDERFRGFQPAQAIISKPCLL
jgi:hypothetical protein